MADRTHPDENVRRAGRIVTQALSDLEPLFTEGMDLAFVAYHPGFPEQDFLIASGDIDELLAAVQRRAEEP